ncbi:MAG TPA: BrnT family toxin, partial [Proteobacteria bacterium]|nr:BrnT family toxin [Pseudomonadota bacterium]
DKANTLKNWEKHCVSPFECEQIFFNRPLVVHLSEGRSGEEERFYCLGQTDTRRMLFLVFTMRNVDGFVKVINATRVGSPNQ